MLDYFLLRVKYRHKTAGGIAGAYYIFLKCNEVARMGGVSCEAYEGGCLDGSIGTGKGFKNRGH
jgi:hypothetical protein